MYNKHYLHEWCYMIHPTNAQTRVHPRFPFYPSNIEFSNAKEQLLQHSLDDQLCRYHLARLVPLVALRSIDQKSGDARSRYRGHEGCVLTRTPQLLDWPCFGLLQHRRSYEHPVQIAASRFFIHYVMISKLARHIGVPDDRLHQEVQVCERVSNSEGRHYDELLDT